MPRRLLNGVRNWGWTRASGRRKTKYLCSHKSPTRDPHAKLQPMTNSVRMGKLVEREAFRRRPIKSLLLAAALSTHRGGKARRLASQFRGLNNTPMGRDKSALCSVSSGASSKKVATVRRRGNRDRNRNSQSLAAFENLPRYLASKQHRAMTISPMHPSACTSWSSVRSSAQR